MSGKIKVKVKVFKPNHFQTLFLDRDGVINERIPGAYVRYPEEFVFTKGCLEALSHLAEIFPRIFIVTNQQGIGRGLMTEAQLVAVHDYMLQQIEKAGGRIDAIYYCPNLAIDNPACRKPNPGMAEQAQKDFPEVDFTKSIMLGDSISDMEFGKNLGMKTVFVEGKLEEVEEAKILEFDMRVGSLGTFFEEYY